MIEIVWDEPKRRRNLTSHGLDFTDIDLAFFAAAKIASAKVGRLMAIGLLEGDMIAVVFVPLGSQGIAIVSMRRASRKERRLYAED